MHFSYNIIKVLPLTPLPNSVLTSIGVAGNKVKCASVFRDTLNKPFGG